MYWALLPLRRYADFSGRSRRTEYWMFQLFQIMAVAVIMAVMGLTFVVAGDGATTAGVTLFLMFSYLLFALASVIPSLAVQVRRFHDIDMSGWSILLGLIPLAGPIIMLVCMCKDGTPGDNRYGPNPKYADTVEDVFA